MAEDIMSSPPADMHWSGVTQCIGCGIQVNLVAFLLVLLDFTRRLQLCRPDRTNLRLLTPVSDFNLVLIDSRIHAVPTYMLTYPFPCVWNWVFVSISPIHLLVQFCHSADTAKMVHTGP